MCVVSVDHVCDSDDTGEGDGLGRRVGRGAGVGQPAQRGCLGGQQAGDRRVEVLHETALAAHQSGERAADVPAGRRAHVRDRPDLDARGPRDRSAQRITGHGHAGAAHPDGASSSTRSTVTASIASGSTSKPMPEVVGTRRWPSTMRRGSATMSVA